VSQLTLLVLQLAFLLVLWGFIFAVVYALRSDLFGQRARRMPPEAPTASAFPSSPISAAPPRPAPVTAPSAPVSAGTASGASATRLVIVSGSKQGQELVLGTEPLTIGRSSESGLVIRDDYTSTHHARLMLWDETWMIQDLDSTNGTFLNGARVTVPTPVPLNTPVKIGTTSFELRR
jgi:pSer/pThr/pTyr-binding forkhead associated (FHA) protein